MDLKKLGINPIKKSGILDIYLFVLFLSQND